MEAIPARRALPIRRPQRALRGARSAERRLGRRFWPSIQALVNQRTAALTITPVAGQGNPNPVYYAIAASEYGAHGKQSVQFEHAGACAARRCDDLRVLRRDAGRYRRQLQQEFAELLRPRRNRGKPLERRAQHRFRLGPDVRRRRGIHKRSDVRDLRAAQCIRLQRRRRGHAATCTATINGTGHVNAVNLTNAGAGYAPNPTCTLTGGGGTGATCTVSGVTDTAYGPAFPATPGWDFATGIGTVNAYNLVFSTQWNQGP